MNAPPPTLPPDSMIGRYRIARRLGVGGMGEVYEALHVDLNKRVAVKILLPAIASRPEIIARFVREGQATAKLRHPHAVDIADVGVDHGVPFLVMEYLDGETLEALIAREAPLAPSRIAELMLPVLAAVNAAHEEEIVHRDLKPANIFLHRSRDYKLTPKVLDFGISKMADEDGASGLTQTASLLGTPHYMSPEQLRSSKYVDARSDQYALGTILYECATRKKPFRGETPYVVMNAIANGAFEPPTAVVPSLLPAFEQMVLRAMSNAPEARYASVHELGCALLTFADARTRAFWESVFDDEPTTALPSWESSSGVRSVPSTPAPGDSLAGARNSVAPTPAPGLSGSIPGSVATPLPGVSAASPETLVGSVVTASLSPPSRSRGAIVAAAGALVLAALGGVALTVTRASTPAAAPPRQTVQSPPREVAARAPVQPSAPPPTVAHDAGASAVTPVAAAPTPPTPEAPATIATAPAAAEETEADAAETRATRHGRRHRRRGHAAGATSSAAGTNDIPILR